MFGRSTKLLLPPRDVPDLQFTSQTEESSEISPNTEVSVTEVVCQSINGDLIEKCGEISPNLENPVKRLDINSNEKYIVGYSGNLKKHGEIPPEATVNEKIDKIQDDGGWFQHPIKCVSKWSKALKLGVVNSMVLDSSYTATVDSEEDDKCGFSFFL